MTFRRALESTSLVITSSTEPIAARPCPEVEHPIHGAEERIGPVRGEEHGDALCSAEPRFTSATIVF